MKNVRVLAYCKAPLRYGIHTVVFAIYTIVNYLFLDTAVGSPWMLAAITEIIFLNSKLRWE